jgi:hypothetical protein
MLHLQRVVMAGFIPAIHVLSIETKTWMPATSAGMTRVLMGWFS